MIQSTSAVDLNRNRAAPVQTKPASDPRLACAPQEPKTTQPQKKDHRACIRKILWNRDPRPRC